MGLFVALNTYADLKGPERPALPVTSAFVARRLCHQPGHGSLSSACHARRSWLSRPLEGPHLKKRAHATGPMPTAPPGDLLAVRCLASRPLSGP